jgi:hypothetical protein
MDRKFRCYILWDPEYREHLVKYNVTYPERSIWEFLDTDVHRRSDVQIFSSIQEARSAGERILRDSEDEVSQLEIKEVELALAETQKSIPRVNNPLE